MKPFINRDWSYDEDTDYQVNVMRHTAKNTEAIPQYGKPTGSDEYIVVGWIIQPRYE